jgi:hypothetical protein
MTDLWRRYVRGDPLSWLLEEDNPSVRYFTLRDLLHRPPDDSELVTARSNIMASRPVQEILSAQYPEGHWIKPDRGYSPKYRATVWQLLFLAELGATHNRAIDRGCRVVLQKTFLLEAGLFSATKYATGTVTCLNGNLLASLCRLGYGDHSTVRTVSHVLAQRIVEEGFDCPANAMDRTRRETWLPCAWGAIKALRAYALIPEGQRSPLVQKAILRGVEFILSHDLSMGDYPSGSNKVSPLWFRLGFPLGYHSDVLEALEVLAQLGRGGDPRLQPAIEFVLNKQDSQGRWPLEHTLDRTWTRFGKNGKPSKWVTSRALRMLSGLCAPTAWVDHGHSG